MLFSSVSFLIFFLPCLLTLYFAIPQRFRAARNLVLLLFSLFFYACGGPRYLFLMLLSISINYLSGRMVGKQESMAWKRAGLLCGIILNIALLAWFKYAGFLSDNLHGLNAAIPVLSIVLPIGISFYTFQGLSYVIDVYRGETPVQKNPLKLALYIALFPQLIAGPIVRYSTIALEIDGRTENLVDASDGIVRFMLGFGKKMIVANAAAEIADAIFSMPVGTLSVTLAWVGALAYTAQIYFDFSAYSDMAIGLGKLFGFHFLENFNYPYIAKSVTEFWRRWHISLSTWFRDYVYIPLGGNRGSMLMHIRNIVLVWFLTGLWHGAAWNFIAWGLWFALFLLAEKFIWGKKILSAPIAVQHVYTMLLVVLSWVLFRAETLPAAFQYMGVMFGFGSDGFLSAKTVYYLLQYWPEWILCILAAIPTTKLVHEALERYKDEKPLAKLSLEWGPKLFALFVFGIGYIKLVSGSFNPFIYFRF